MAKIIAVKGYIVQAPGARAYSNPYSLGVAHGQMSKQLSYSHYPVVILIEAYVKFQQWLVL
jgi:hypothetical protein